MITAVAEDIRVGTLDEVTTQGCTVVTGASRTLAVFYSEGDVFAVDNRFPHMGFPLSCGTVKDGILTCHWHHAKFDLTRWLHVRPLRGRRHLFPGKGAGQYRMGRPHADRRRPARALASQAR